MKERWNWREVHSYGFQVGAGVYLVTLDYCGWVAQYLEGFHELSQPGKFTGKGVFLGTGPYGTPQEAMEACYEHATSMSSVDA